MLLSDWLPSKSALSTTPIPSDNIYAPNTTTKQSWFFQTFSELICDNEYKESDYKILLGEELNVTMDPDLDCSGGNPAIKESVKCVEDAG